MTTNNNQNEVYEFILISPFIFLFLEFLCFIDLSTVTSNIYFFSIVTGLKRISFLNNLYYIKGIELFFAIVVGIGTKAKKNLDFSPVKHVIIPTTLGLILLSLAILSYQSKPTAVLYDIHIITYIISSCFGLLLFEIGGCNISKYLKNNFKKDVYNIENESFMQTIDKIENDYSINIPMKFYFKKRTHKGWINIVNPFRGTLLIGTPGSGKSFSVVNSFIKQHSAKGFALVVYDFKFPDLTKIVLFHYLLHRKEGKLRNFNFHIINFSDVERSRRINPLKREYIQTLSDAIETSEALVESLQKNDKIGGNADFFKTSAVNLLSACIYFFSRYENGKFSDLPHVIAFLTNDYESIFDVLFTNPELEPLMSPFKKAYENKAMDQLEGQMGSLKIQISRLASKESFYIFSGDEINLKVSEPSNPSYLIIANSPQTQSMNSALNALVLNRLTRLVNTKGNLPTSIIIDEAPTIYFYQLSNLLSTARSNKVSVLLGLQELPQLEEQYGRQNAKTIQSVIGNVIAGQVRSKESLDWLQALFGKKKQLKESVSFNDSSTNLSISEQMDYMIPEAKIATLPAGSLVAQVATDFGQDDNFETKNYNCKTDLDIKQIQQEEKHYIDIPKFRKFKSVEDKEQILLFNYKRIYNEVNSIIKLVKQNKTINKE